jgi:hypothetical protein
MHATLYDLSHMKKLSHLAKQYAVVSNMLDLQPLYPYP